MSEQLNPDFAVSERNSFLGWGKSYIGRKCSCFYSIWISIDLLLTFAHRMKVLMLSLHLDKHRSAVDFCQLGDTKRS